VSWRANLERELASFWWTKSQARLSIHAMAIVIGISVAVFFLVLGVISFMFMLRGKN